MQEIAYTKMAAGEERAGWSLIRESDRLKACGTEYLNLTCDGEQMSFYVPISCKSRICPDCGRRLYGRIVERTKQVIADVLSRRQKGYFLTLLTLTFNKDRYGDKLPDRAGIARAYRESSAFLSLFFGKHKAAFIGGKVVPVYKSIVNPETGRKKRVKVWRGGGYMAVMEVGQDNNNLHVHAICYGHYVAYAGMSRTWAQITGDSNHVDFDTVHSPSRAANYVLKYITKPPQTDSWQRLAAYAGMVKGTRRLRAGGIFYNALAEADRERLSPDCPFCGKRLQFRGYTSETETAGKNRQAMLLPLLRTVKDREGVLIPTWSTCYGRALTGDLRN